MSGSQLHLFRSRNGRHQWSCWVIFFFFFFLFHSHLLSAVVAAVLLLLQTLQHNKNTGDEGCQKGQDHS